MKKCGEFCRRHRAALVLLGVGVGALCLFWAARGNRLWMDWWLEGVSMPLKRAFSAVVDPLPFSACEAGATALILLELALLARAIWQAVRRHKNTLAAWALHLCTLLVCRYAAVCALWGTQYYGTTFAEKAGMGAPPITVAALQTVTDYFTAQVNAAAVAVPRDENENFAVDKAEIFAASAATYDALLAEYPFLAGAQRTPKPAFYSKIMSAAGFTGYLCPLFGESTLNVDCPAVFLPATITHELAHQRGVAAEQEANYVGVRAAVSSGQAAYVYSGWLFGYLHLSNALYTAAPEAATQNYAALCSAARADLAQNNAYWAAWEGPAQAVGERVYTNFLQGYGQELGMQSYGACVDLLVEYYLPQAQAQ